jgi:hypothetical protein
MTNFAVKNFKTKFQIGLTVIGEKEWVTAFTILVMGLNQQQEKACIMNQTEIEIWVGLNALLSTHFYYFGEEPRPLPDNLRVIIKKNQGHLKIEKQDIIETFEHWIQQFEKNKIIGDPQLKHEFDRVISDDYSVSCSIRDLEDDKYEGEERIC